MKTEIVGTVNINGKKYYKVCALGYEKENYKLEDLIEEQFCRSCALYDKLGLSCELECRDHDAAYFIKYEDRKNS